MRGACHRTFAVGLSLAEAGDGIPTAPSLGFGSLRRIDPGGRYHDGLPTVAIHSRGFSPPQRFDPARALWLYFTPHPPMGFGLQRLPHPVSRNASQRPCSPAVELRWLPTRTSTSERYSNRASVHPTVAVKRVIGAGALLTFVPSEAYQPGRWACALPSCTYSRYRPATQASWATTEGGTSGCQSDRA